MRSSINLVYLRNSEVIRPNREICVIDARPPSISLDDLITTAINIVRAADGDYSGILTQVEGELKEALGEKNAIFSASDHLEFLRAGSYLVNGERVHPDEIRVVFKATSEDNITNSFGRADQPAGIWGEQIIDRGEDKQTHQYTCQFSIPLEKINPGEYIFTFASGDDGWLFDVGVSTVLTVSILPRPA
jgi:hypothetical protein